MNVTDFDKAFRDGYTFKYKMPDDEVNDVTFSVHSIGELVLTSGKLVACDPLLEPDESGYFSERLKPGRYPVILSVADFQLSGDNRIACAMLRLSEEAVVKWEMALLPKHNLSSLESGEFSGYGVDSGTGCFMDADAAAVVTTLANPDPTAYKEAMKVSREQGWGLTRTALERFEREYCDRLIEEMEKNYTQAGNNKRGDWGNIRVSDSTEANVVAFSSGWGDGGYPSFWGYDAENKIVCLVTDFLLFYEEEQEEDEA